jgi:hypothetical protein
VITKKKEEGELNFIPCYLTNSTTTLVVAKLGIYSKKFGIFLSLLLGGMVWLLSLKLGSGSAISNSIG